MIVQRRSYCLLGGVLQRLCFGLFGSNDTTGVAFDLFNGVFPTLTTPGEMENTKAVRQANGDVLANFLDSSFLVEGACSMQTFAHPQ